LLVNFRSTEQGQRKQACEDARIGKKDLAVLLRDTKHVADHNHRKPESKISNEIHMALRLHVIDDFVNDLLNARSHVVDASGGKGVGHEIAQAAMIRRIKVRHPMTHRPINWLV